MNFIFKSEIIDYDFTNKNKKDTILFLHGWGGDKNSFCQTHNLIKSKYNHISITLPTTKKTNTIWTMFDYKNLVLSLLKLHNLEKLIVICHSFGFRIATMIKDEISIKKIVVTGGAGLRRNDIYKKHEQENNIILLKNKNNHYLYNKIASEDYKNLSKTNKETFKNIVNFNTKNLIKFTCPLLLFWGEKDKSTPLWMAKKIWRANNSTLFLTKSDHFAYLKETSVFNHEIMKFLEAK